MQNKKQNFASKIELATIPKEIKGTAYLVMFFESLKGNKKNFFFNEYCIIK